MVQNASDLGQEQVYEGASIRERLIEAARRNNIDLMEELIDSVPNPEELASLLNNTKTVSGDHIYHVAALNGNYDIIDLLLDQEGFECDPKNREHGDTPLHSAIRYINNLDKPTDPDVITFAEKLIFMMIESGSDPRIKNNAKLTPYELADPQNVELRRIIQDAIDAEQNKGDYVSEDQAEISLGFDTESASDSDV